MKSLSLISLIGAVSITLAETPPHTADASSQYQTLITQLGSDVFAERDSAMKALWSAGDACVAALKSADVSDDPERRKRVEILIRNIESGILPGTDPVVIGAVEKYRKTSSTMVKSKALETLIKKGAYKQALHLLHREEDASVQKTLASKRSIQAVAVVAAREALAKGKLEEALALLNIAPKTDYNYRALAYLLKSTGRLDQQIAAFEVSDKASIERQLMFLRVQGDVNAVKEFARQHKLKEVLITTSLVEGDAHPLIGKLISSSEKATHQRALEALLEFHKTNDSGSIHETLRELIDDLDAEANGGNDLEYLLRISMWLGDRELGEELLLQYSKEEAMGYYSRQVNSEKEFALFDIPNPTTQEEAFAKWLKNEINRELDEELGLLDDQVSTIEAVAWFYVSRGEYEVATSILSPLLEALQEAGDDRWYDLMTMIGMQGMGQQLVHIVEEKGEVDEEDLDTLVYSLLGDSESLEFLREEIDALHPDLKPLESFKLLLTLAGIHSDSAQSLEKVEGALYEHGEQLGKKKYLKMVEALAYVAEARGDLIGMLRFNKELCDDLNYATEKGFLRKYQFAAESTYAWKEVIAAYDLDPTSYRGSISMCAFYAVAKMKVGEEELGRKLLDEAKRRTLGVAKNVNEVALVLLQAGYKKEAKELWNENLLTLNTEKDLYFIVNAIKNLSKLHIQQGGWKLADAFLLAEKAVYMDPGVRYTDGYSPLREGFMSTFVHGLALIDAGKRAEGVRILDFAHSLLVGDGTLADDFFPNVLGLGIDDKVDAWFEASWAHLEKELELYPRNHNVYNTSAWLGSRSVRRLDESMRYVNKALTLQPGQPAYLDTLAETHFAKRDRKNAINQSDDALKSIREGVYGYTRGVARARGLYSDLLDQNRRFRSSAFPER